MVRPVTGSSHGDGWEHQRSPGPRGGGLRVPTSHPGLGRVFGPQAAVGNRHLAGSGPAHEMLTGCERNRARARSAHPGRSAVQDRGVFVLRYQSRAGHAIAVTVALSGALHSSSRSAVPLHLDLELRAGSPTVTGRCVRRGPGTIVSTPAYQFGGCAPPSS